MADENNKPTLDDEPQNDLPVGNESGQEAQSVPSESDVTQSVEPQTDVAQKSKMDAEVAPSAEFSPVTLSEVPVEQSDVMPSKVEAEASFTPDAGFIPAVMPEQPYNSVAPENHIQPADNAPQNYETPAYNQDAPAVPQPTDATLPIYAQPVNEQYAPTPYGHENYAYTEGNPQSTATYPIQDDQFHAPINQFQDVPQPQFGERSEYQANTGPLPQFKAKSMSSSRKSVLVGGIAGAIGAVFVIALFLVLTTTGVMNLSFTSSANIATLGNVSDYGEPGKVQGSSSSQPNWEAVGKNIASTVVSIRVEGSDGTALGSGVIVSKEGNIITNYHVISGADAAKNAKVTVILQNGSMYEAGIKGTDSTADLALLEIKNPPDNLSAAVFGNSDDARVGQQVMAVGNPLGYENTATTGIISALNRPVAASDGTGSSETTVTNAIQIDAAINSGNSGGPLFDGDGRILGITSSIATSGTSTGSIGIGFAIPSNAVNNIYKQLEENGKAEHAYLGIMMEDVTVKADNVTRSGAQITKVENDTPASKSGLKVGDVIVAIDSKPVTNGYSLVAFIREYLPDATVSITFVRDGDSKAVDVKLATAVAEEPKPQEEEKEETPNSEDEFGFIDPFQFFFSR
ncbi:MAG: trypsin-like peptidase domain-containing protein [Bifidobacteriaceae bacterium]|jgi:putative serine protease PepD|nr:trypsin-like peptidase domain-containing protein [Bifidobacteriaceae bacterium]